MGKITHLHNYLCPGAVINHWCSPALRVPKGSAAAIESSYQALAETAGAFGLWGFTVDTDSRIKQPEQLIGSSLAKPIVLQGRECVRIPNPR